MGYFKGLIFNRAGRIQDDKGNSNRVPNSASGLVFEVTDWSRLDRFLILGSEGGSYYASERKLSMENAEVVKQCIALDGARTVARIVEVSEAGRAPKNDQALFALAVASSFGSDETRRLALGAVNRVCRTGTHLFQFAEFVNGMRGWGRGLRSAVGGWYTEMPADRLAYQAIKYQSRGGWSHRDMLRLAHPTPSDEARKALYFWMTKGWASVGDEPHPDTALRTIWASERAKRAQSAGEIAGLIRDYKLPREAIPTNWLTEPDVWEALLEEMPITAMVRNLATMTRIGLLTEKSAATRSVINQLQNETRLRAARVHPLAILGALKTYASGKGVRGSGEWLPVKSVVNALDSAFYLAFGNVVPTGKRFLLGLDVSGSMTCGSVAGSPGLTPRVATAAMAMVTASVERDCETMAFMDRFVRFDLRPSERLDSVVSRMDNLPFGATDCSLPMQHASSRNLKVDVFIVLTDNETWAGQDPTIALREYRQKSGIAAKLIVVGMVSNGFTIADPEDGGMLDVVGFDSATPQLISDFAGA